MRCAATIPALAHIHRMLRKAVEASRGGSGGSQAAGRGAVAAADSDDDEDSPAAIPRQAAVAAPLVEPAARNAELLTAMQVKWVYLGTCNAFVLTLPAMFDSAGCR